MKSSKDRNRQGESPSKNDGPAKTPPVHHAGDGSLVADVYCATEQEETFWRVEVGFSEMPARGAQFQWRDTTWEIIGSTGYGFLAMPAQSPHADEPTNDEPRLSESMSGTTGQPRPH